MCRSAVPWLLAIGLGFASASPALAQSEVATLSLAEGAVTRVHAGALAAATIDVSLIDGDQIETAAGRAEVTFLDGTIAHLDRDTRILLTAHDGLQLLKGRVSLRTSGFKEYEVETEVAKLLVQAGSIVEVRVRANRADAFLNVISGVARVVTPSGVQRVGDYYTAYVAGPASAATVTKTASTQADDFGRWTLARTVMATSIALKGTEGGGGVNNSWYYSSPSYASSQSYYDNSYYRTPSYGSPYYWPSYYSSYYTTPYYSYGYDAGRYSYYNPYSYAHSYSFSFSSGGPPGQRGRGGDSPRPSHPIAAPRTAQGMSRGAAVPRP